MPENRRPAEQLRSRLPSLTGLRFFAALLVFCFHVTLANSPIPPNKPINPFADPALADATAWLFSKAGYVGVSFFFVLSGFVLTWSSREGERARPFWRRRLLKIFPNHLVMWSASMLLFAAAITPWTAWLPNIFLVHSFFPQADIYVGVNPPSWTLCSELLFYLAFPFLIRPIRRIPVRSLWFWVAVAVAGMVAVELVTQFLIPDTPRSPITPVSTTQFWFGYIFPPSRLFEFIIGVLLARIILAGKWPAVTIPQALLATAGGYVAALYVPFLYGFTVATIVPIVALIGAVATADLRGTSRMLARPTMRWLGEVSFGFYLCQGVTVFYVRRLLGHEDGFGTPAALAVIVLFLIVTLAGGWLLYALVERPAMQRWARSRKPGEVAEPAVPTPVR
ncbi:acyltransferase family protein [Krasilnikovia sp. M28-CT-15]|uniref:acyltransferase family protein n=1 Tax=Krasilnikovia sp. M28-CT-15 TaxID=3373540 RepID=UPI00399C8A7B